MRRVLITAMLMAVFFSSCLAVSDTVSQKKSIQYFNLFSSGAMLAKTGGGTSFTFQTIHGIRKGKVAIALGVGYDTYSEWKIIPVVASVSYDFVAIRSSNLFVQASGGIVSGNQIKNENVYDYSFNKGTVWHPCLGYRVDNGKWNVYFLAGYKIQNIQYNQIYSWWNWPGNTTTVDRQIQRLTISLGVGLH